MTSYKLQVNGRRNRQDLENKKIVDLRLEFNTVSACIIRRLGATEKTTFGILLQLYTESCIFV